MQYSEVHISVATMKAMTVDQIVFSTGAFYVIVFFLCVCVVFDGVDKWGK